jgi:predicted nucleic acid-binding Zn ribbon protein
MKKVEYRCYWCMIVESKVLADNVKSTDYTTCSKCGGESKRISSESISLKYSASLQEFKRKSR